MKLEEIKNLPTEFNDLINRKGFSSLPLWENTLDNTKYIFELTADTIYLGVYYEGKANYPPNKPGEFGEGLWNYDLIEAFLSTSDNSYIEINLALNGSWWAAEFTDYRKKSLNFPKIKLKELFKNANADINITIASFSYEQLAFSKKFNLSAILNKKHYSLNKAPLNTQPDFHLKDLRC